MVHFASMATSRRSSSSDFIVGMAAIGAHFGRSRTTIWRWITREGLPAAKMPGGHWAITRSLIDQWLLARNRAWIEGRKPMPQAEGTQP